MAVNAATTPILTGSYWRLWSFGAPLAKPYQQPHFTHITRYHSITRYYSFLLYRQTQTPNYQGQYRRGSLESRGNIQALVAPHDIANVLHTGTAQGIQEWQEVQKLCILRFHLPRLDLQCIWLNLVRTSELMPGQTGTGMYF